MSESERVLRALKRYARTAPIDLKSAREIQDDLLVIATNKPHYHVSLLPADNRECYLCGRDLMAEEHIRQERG